MSCKPGRWQSLFPALITKYSVYRGKSDSLNYANNNGVIFTTYTFLRICSPNISRSYSHTAQPSKRAKIHFGGKCVSGCTHLHHQNSMSFDDLHPLYKEKPYIYICTGRFRQKNPGIGVSNQTSSILFTMWTPDIDDRRYIIKFEELMYHIWDYKSHQLDFSTGIISYA